MKTKDITRTTGLLLVLAIRAYQRWAPARVKGRCPNVPHCSAYGLRAARLHGSVRGGLMAYRRIMSCGAVAVALLASDAQVEDWCCGDTPINRLGINGWDDCITCTPGEQ